MDKCSCIRYTKMELNNTDNKTCDACIEYIGEKLVCEKCFKSYTRITKNRHYRSYKCRICIFKEL